MQTVVIDCAGVQTEDEFWQRYLDAANPEGRERFGKNLDAFWDAIERGGPGWPGHVGLELVNATALSRLSDGIVRAGAGRGNCRRRACEF